MRSLLRLCVASVLTCTLSSTGLAQHAAEPQVDSTGTAKLERRPNILRMTIELSGKGATAREALTKLKDRRELALAQLDTLGAAKEAIKLGEPAISAATTDRQRQMQQMIQQRMIGRGKKGAKPEIKQPVIVSLKLTAQWPLAATSAEELVLAAVELQEKIKKADLAGLKTPEKLTPEEEEIAEETAAEEVISYGGSEPAKPGEPQFVFVSPISDQEYGKLQAEAFTKARAKAEALAAAAGAELGALTRISEQDVTTVTAYQQYYGSDPYSSVSTSTGPNADSGSREAVGAEPGKVSYQVIVSASFSMK